MLSTSTCVFEESHNRYGLHRAQLHQFSGMEKNGEQMVFFVEGRRLYMKLQVFLLYSVLHVILSQYVLPLQGLSKGEGNGTFHKGASERFNLGQLLDLRGCIRG